MKKYFQDKVIVITGGGAGLGQALAIEMAHHNARIFVLDINKNWAKETSEMILQNGGKASYYQVDVTDFEQLSDIIEKIYKTEGKIDILINNAGISVTGEVRDMHLKHWSKAINLNLMGVIHGITIVYPKMVKQGFGQIVNIASMAGLAPVPFISPYVTSKYAVVGLSRSLRLEAQGLGVKVNLVCPGRLNTSILDHSMMVNVDKKKLQSNVPFNAMPLTKAVNKILKGIVINKSLIIFPPYVRWLWLADRYFPLILKPFYRYSIKQFRKMRE